MKREAKVLEPEYRSENWNIADSYAKLKILKVLVELDQAEKQATFGTSNIYETIQFTPAQKNMVKREAFHLLCYNMRLLISNTKFAVKRKDRTRMNEYLEIIDKVEGMMKEGIAFRMVHDARNNTQELVFIDDKYMKLLRTLKKLKMEMNEPLNRANLIFQTVEDESSAYAKEKLMQELIMGG